MIKYKKTGKAALYLGDEKVDLAQPLTLHKPKAQLKLKHPCGSEEVVDIDVTPPSGYIGPVAKIGCKLGATISTGNYENVKVDVWLEMPCYPQEVDTVFEYVHEWCNDRLELVGDAAKKEYG